MTISETRPFTFDPYDEAVWANPLPYYEVLRDNYPAYYLEQYDTWVISRFDDVFEVLADPDDHFIATEGTVVGKELLSVHNAPGTTVEQVLEPLDKFPRLKDPMYSTVRQQMGAPFRPRAAQRLEPFIREQATQLLDELIPQGQFDVVLDYGGIVAARTMCLLFGLPLTEAYDLLYAVNNYARKDPETGAFDPTQADRLNELSLEAVTRRRAAGADGTVPGVDGLINFDYNGRKLTDAEIVAQLFIVLMGGTETVPKVVGHGLLELQRHPDQRAEVGADLDSLRVAFEEILRYCAPAQWFLRTVAKPITLGGQRLEVGQRVIPLNMSANRDEREFENANEFHWDRDPKRHVAFGQGLKFCIGSHVARLEGRILMQELVSRIPDYVIDEETAFRPPSNFQWGYSSLQLSTSA